MSELSRLYHEVDDRITSAEDTAGLQDALQSFALAQTQIIAFYDAGMIGRDDALDQILRLQAKLMKRTHQIEVDTHSDLAQNGGFETLTTDTRGHHDIEWFNKHRKPFATGLATRCFACALVHDEYGMAASHRNTVRLEDYQYNLEKLLDSEQYRQQAERGEFSVLGTMVTHDSLARSINEVIGQAFSEFGWLVRDGFPLSGTHILFAGLDYLPQDQINPVVNRAAQEVNRHIGGMALGQNTVYGIDTGGIGERCGIIWGGPKHSSYSIPTFYTL